MKFLISVICLLILQAECLPLVAPAAQTHVKCTEERSTGASYIEFEFVMASVIVSLHLENIDEPALCVMDRTYGVRNTTVWMMAGCEAEAFVCYQMSSEPIYERLTIDPSTNTVKPVGALGFPMTSRDPVCINEWSSGNSRVLIKPARAAVITSVDVSNIEQEFTCMRNKGYGVVGALLWVDVTCQAEFEICFRSKF